MKTATTRRETDSTKQEKVLYVALELGKAKWRVGSVRGLGKTPSGLGSRRPPRRACREIERPKKVAWRLRPVVCCYEAGREGFGCIAICSIAVNNRWWIPDIR
jgi:hypothetical protein